MVSRRVNQSRIADLTQKDKKQISEYVNNHTTPYKSTQIEMADSLGVVMDHLDDAESLAANLRRLIEMENRDD